MKNDEKLMNKNKKNIIALVLLIIILFLFIWYQNNHIVITFYQYKSSKLSGNDDKFSLVQISDLHNAHFGNNNENLLKRIKSLEADMIVITGDIVDSNHTNIDIAINFVRDIAEKYPVYYVTGNHEYWLDESERDELFTGIKDAGAVILNNERISVDAGDKTISLIGLDDNSLDDATLSSIMKGCNKDLLTVVLAHEPQYLDKYSNAGVDLVLTGHAHGGQMILPFIGPLIAPDQGFFPKYTAGRFERESTIMYISRGLGNSVIPVRLFNYPEIVCIEIQVDG